MVSPARRAAYETVLRVFEQDAYADRALPRAAANLDQRDRGLAQRQENPNGRELPGLQLTT